jgi:hypothetical protein
MDFQHTILLSQRNEEDKLFHMEKLEIATALPIAHKVVSVLI